MRTPQSCSISFLPSEKPSKGQLCAWLGKPTPRLAGLVWDAWWQLSLFGDCLSLGTSHWAGQPGCALLAVCPAVHPAVCPAGLPGFCHPHPAEIQVNLVVLPRRNLRQFRIDFWIIIDNLEIVLATPSSAHPSEPQQQPGWEDEGLSIKAASLTPVDPDSPRWSD